LLLRRRLRRGRASQGRQILYEKGGGEGGSRKKSFVGV